MPSCITIPFKDSEIKGIEQTSLNDKKYYSFLGIPYAQPPVGSRRFKNPALLENYSKNLDATKLGNCSIHYDELQKSTVGSEDCLYLNIFTPKVLPFDSLLPVMIYFHGGAYRAFSGSTFTPHLLIEYDIIVVTFNYRLHALGFLDLGLPDCTGNMGLKDQLCVLQWVKNNIKYFNGDADNITLYGISSGAASAHMLVMSPLNKNLANKMILVGGNALNTWHVNPAPEKLAFELGKKFGYEGDDKNELLELLKSVSAIELYKAVFSLHNSNVLMPRSHSFRPTIERIKEGALLPDFPQKLWGNVKNVTIIHGIGDHEGTVFLRKPKFAELIVQHDALKVFISDITSVEKHFLENLFEEIVQYYGITEKDDQECFNARMALFTDILLKHYYLETNFIRPPSNLYEVYSYEFSYLGDHNKMSNWWKPLMKWNVEGTVHADDFGYLIPEEKWYSPERDRKIADITCTLWTNFMKYGTPNGEIFNQWKPSTTEMPSYLQIGENLIMKNQNFNADRAKFWKYLYEKYSL